MAKFTQNIRFDLEIIGNDRILTCMCDEEYEIEFQLFDKCETLFKCPYCNKLWYFEEDIQEKTILLIDPETNSSIALKHNGSKWVVNDEYYSRKW
ncbi:hypothetical protein ACR77J_07690 [Tissierella praeacuta]|uniref:hypothetical protein n=1 Tax=Tissierella praeacuta TaxID=43131 RepID=UPI003DA361BA